jgi:hypothetical protein
MTNQHAKIVAGMMPDDEAKVLRAIGNENMAGIAKETIDSLSDSKFIKQTENLLTNEMIWILTADGKKVRQYL